MSASTPISAKKRSPPSATKPQAKRVNSNVNMAANCTKENEEEYLSAMDSEEDICTSEDELEDPKATVLSPELVLLNDILRLELSADLDQSIETKLSPLQTSIDNLAKRGPTTLPSAEIKRLEDDKKQLKTLCENILKENKELKARLRNMERSLKENNLIFSSLTEGPWKTANTTFDKVYNAITSIMSGNSKETKPKRLTL